MTDNPDASRAAAAAPEDSATKPALAAADSAQKRYDELSSIVDAALDSSSSEAEDSEPKKPSPQRQPASHEADNSGVPNTKRSSVVAENSEDKDDDDDSGSASPKRRTPSPVPSNAGKPAQNKDVIEVYWNKVKDKNASDVENLPEAIRYGCSAVRLHNGPRRQFAAMLAEPGIIGMFDTREEAIKRAVCAAMVQQQFDNAGGEAKLTPSSFAKGLDTKKAAHKNDSDDSDSSDSSDDSDDYNNHDKKKTTSHHHSDDDDDDATVTDDDDDDDFVMMGDKPPIIAKPFPAATASGKLSTTTTTHKKKRPRPSSDKLSRKGLPRPCEMYDQATQKIVKVFPSLNEAASVTGMKRTEIQRACRDGGGIVDGNYFRYADEDDDEEEEPAAAKKTKKASSTKETMPSSQRQQRPKHSLLMKNHPSSKTTNHNPNQRFDVSTLKPVKKKYATPLRPDKIIELIEKASNSVLVCFRGATDTRCALGLERKVVTAACKAYGTYKQNQYGFGTYVLRYAACPDASLPMAYEYGAHKEDYKPTTETHSQIMARWARVYVQDRNAHHASSSLQPHETPFHNRAAAITSIPPSLANGATLGAADIYLAQDTKTPQELRREAALATDDDHDHDVSNLCLICQEHAAQIVLEPCRHAVLCIECSESNKGCRRFCPLCRTPIVSKVQPTVVRLIRPRIYSAYSFM